MKLRLLFLLKYYLFWICLFLIQKIIFMFYNFSESNQLGFTDWILILFHGLKLDFSAGAYIMVIPVLVLTLTSLFRRNIFKSFVHVYTYIFLFVVLYLGVVDMALYSYWGFKLDLTPLMYMKTPREVMASISYFKFAILFVFFILLYFLWLMIYRKVFSGISENPFRRNYPFSIAGLIILAMLFVPVRGGIGIAPMNISTVYFHPNRFANHSAINVLWNTAYSVVERKKLQVSYHFMEDQAAESLFDQFYPEMSPSDVKVIKEKPNIVLIILESFSNRIIGALGGEDGICPELDKICSSSLVFSNFFATGDRSDKGIVGIFSGFPAQPTTSIINYPSKTQSLPFLLDPFHDDGYYTAFYYGGNIDFANFRSYLTHPALDRIITSDDFPSSLNKQKWGVPDEFLLSRILQDIDTIKKQFFISCFTLSSHDPYDFPGESFFGNSNYDEKSKSGFYYTDHYIGQFISTAKMKPWWDNTLIIILSDHGSRTPYQVPNHVRAKFQIPMIWTGGAVAAPGEMSKYSSQTDLPLTLLRQYGYPANGYRYSKDIFDPASRSFAFYFFNHGFGFMSDSVTLIYDCAMKNYIINDIADSTSYVNASKAYLQILSNDFHSLNEQ